MFVDLLKRNAIENWQIAFLNALKSIGEPRLNIRTIKKYVYLKNL